jgi:hypothetical protein
MRGVGHRRPSWRRLPSLSRESCTLRYCKNLHQYLVVEDVALSTFVPARIHWMECSKLLYVIDHGLIAWMVAEPRALLLGGGVPHLTALADDGPVWDLHQSKILATSPSLQTSLSLRVHSFRLRPYHCGSVIPDSPPFSLRTGLRTKRRAAVRHELRVPFR